MNLKVYTILFFSFNPIFGQTYHEGNILELIKQYLPNNPIILEAGAHRGEDTKKMSICWPKSKIYAFEPGPVAYRELQEKTNNLLNVNCYPYALSDKAGKSDFYICTNGTSASSLLPPKPILAPYLFFLEPPIQVDCITIDEWATKNNVSHIDFMWLDMEGAELKALQASPIILSTLKVIYMEVNYQEFREGNCFYNEVKDWLEPQGFKEVWNHSWVVGELDWQGNILFVRQ